MTALPPRRFATGTSVSVEKSRVELERLLSRHGAAQVAVATDRAQRRGQVVFRLGGRTVRLCLVWGAPPLPSRLRWLSTSVKDQWIAKASTQAEREAWRRVLLVTKAKLELVADGNSTVEREFLSDVLLPDGRTVHEALAEQIERAYLDGKMPPLLGPAVTT